jgi:hypothetical protein
VRLSGKQLKILMSAYNECTSLVPLSVSYRKVCSVMHQLRNTKVYENHLLLMVNCLEFKMISVQQMKKLYFYLFDVKLFYISLPS